MVRWDYVMMAPSAAQPGRRTLPAGLLERLAELPDVRPGSIDDVRDRVRVGALPTDAELAESLLLHVAAGRRT